MKKLTLIIVAATILLGVSAFTWNDRYFEILKNMEIYTNVYKELNANYVDDIDPGELMKIGIDAMTTSLDPYTNYISEARVENYRISTQGKYEGIGAMIREVDGVVTVVDAFENSPALKAGMKIGDQIKAINGLSTSDKSGEDVLTLFRGVPGTKVEMTIDRPGEQKGMKIQLIREEVSIPNVPHSGMVSDEVAYVSLTTFTANASANIRKNLNKLKKENPEMKAVILDLRNNGGGLLREAINVSNIFIPQGLPVVSTRGKVAERDKSYSTTNNSWDTEIPLVVLINKSSASASEIVSGVIQDYDRGVLMGQRSFGKGLVQNTAEVGYNSRLKLTISKYYIPSNRCIQSVAYENGEPIDIEDDKRSTFKTRNGRPVLDGGGVTPDVKIPAEKITDFSQALIDQYIIFKYVNQYVSKHDSISGPIDFQFEEYDEFVKFAESNQFVFESKGEKLLKELETSIQKNEVDLTSEVEGLSSKIKNFYKNSFENYRDEVTELIAEEIINRYYFEEGKVQRKLDQDQEIQEAIKLLGDPKRYQEILN
ncbi:S41 family peptidase [Portibacter lacus]|uniref:Peptidase S41 n=1 Tax=Portibacter lacus TaxID=1099794 RepID=A0AA37SV13_9BACT|nr:S41 family peptidase [Portibacter lacus]GLR18648.1 peptidase S41 [Portibacter lacus]